MATQSGTNVEIRKFDGKNFALWKEMMQDVLIIKRQVEAIRHNEKLASMIAEEWRSLDEIARTRSRSEVEGLRIPLLDSFYNYANLCYI